MNSIINHEGVTRNTTRMTLQMMLLYVNTAVCSVMAMSHADNFLRKFLIVLVL